ncbi:hypothetical protein T05_8788 [Trichinella murrelli]|uniref:Uncharacterized protein n=1 Tax=Trichinella murrelli TaxID=144512 RepID=A0A0V0U3C6_9BILA|nr:hypothetical protein T05_8788 [Trichinella murrelli]
MPQRVGPVLMVGSSVACAKPEKGALRWTLTSGQGDNCKLLHSVQVSALIHPRSMIIRIFLYHSRRNEMREKNIKWKQLPSKKNRKEWPFSHWAKIFPIPFGKIYQYQMQRNNSVSRTRKRATERRFPRSTRLIRLVRCFPMNSCGAVMTRWCAQSKGHLAGPSSSSLPPPPPSSSSSVIPNLPENSSCFSLYFLRSSSKNTTP